MTEVRLDTLSSPQHKFIIAAMSAGYDVFHYSGRGMMGEECPAIQVENVADFASPVPYESDQLGMGYVIYCPGK